MEETIDEIADFLSDETWWNPILEFKINNCVLFSNGKNMKIQELVCFRAYLHVLYGVIEYELCKKLKITPDEFDNIVYNAYIQENYRAKIILETLKKATDFEEFRRDMIRHNDEMEEEMNEMIEQFACEKDIENLDVDMLSESMNDIIQKSAEKINNIEKEKMSNLLFKIKEPEQPMMQFAPRPPSEPPKYSSCYIRVSKMSTARCPRRFKGTILKPEISKLIPSLRLRRIGVVLPQMA